MKTKMNANRHEENNENNLMPRLSEQALYLIALAKLLKKEFGVTSLEEFLTPGGLTNYRGKILT